MSVFNSDTNDSQYLNAMIDRGFQVLSYLINNPTTTKQLALREGLSRARMQYIVDSLVERGLISRTSDQSIKQGEVYYVAKVEDIALALGNDSPKTQVITAIQVILDSITRNVLQTIKSSEANQEMTLRLVQARIPTERSVEFRTRLSRLAEEFCQAEDLVAKEEVALVVGLYPVLPLNNEY